jgi:nitrile hydratase subunit beta
MRHVHDRGGWPNAGPVERTEHDYAVWEKRTDAMLRVLTGDKRLIRVDELRRAIESIPPKDYETMSYYERWITAIEALMIEKGLLTREEIDHRVETLEATRQA